MSDTASDFIDFLYWLKEKTEKFWSVNSKTSPENLKCEGWLYGARWQGLTEDQIDSIERKYSVKFTAEHRAFLRVLHAVNHKEPILIDDPGHTAKNERPYFYNWLTDHSFIEQSLRWPFDKILQDVISRKSPVWLKSWGQMPASTKDKEVLFAKWYQEAPLLLPLKNHTFLVSDSNLEKRPVLSIWGADIIISGWSLKAYLISEFAPALGLLEMIYSEEDKTYYPEFRKNVLKTFGEYFQFKLIHNVPYWKEMIRYYNSET